MVSKVEFSLQVSAKKIRVSEKAQKWLY